MSRSLAPGLARDLRTAAIAVVVTLLVTATPSLAAKVENADKVDGKHAVAAKASASKRAGKLVATDRAGHLPADLIPTALDAHRLGGRDAASYRTKVAASGELMTGVFGIVTVNYADEQGVTFPAALSSDLPGTRITVVPPGGATAECPAVGQVSVNGWLCVYETQALKLDGLSAFDPVTTTGGVNRRGFLLYATCANTGTCIADGVWAVRAP